MFYVILKTSVEGFHRWPNAGDVCSFLRSNHRHVFEIRCMCYVTDSDREVEIITKQREVFEFLSSEYGSPCQFGTMSCEQIAETICVRFGFNSVEVLEDGISGGGYKVCTK